MTPEQYDQFLAAMQALLIAGSDGIESVKLRDSEVHTGARLIWLAKESNGYVNLSHDEAMSLCGTNARSTLRYHLSRLRNAGVLRTYSTNGTVRVKVAGYPGSELIVHERARTASTNTTTPSTNSRTASTPEEESSESRERCSRDRAAGQLLRAAGSRDRAAGQHYNRNFDDYPQQSHVVVVSSNTTPSTDGTLPTNYSPDALEEAQSVSLLLDTDVRSRPKDAYRLAKHHSFTLIREAVGHWWSNRRSMGGKFDETPGIIPHWLDNLENFTIPPLSKEFMASDLYMRHRTKEEIEAHERNEAEAMAALADLPHDHYIDEPTDDQPWPEENDTWNNALALLESELPASTFKAWLAGSAAEFAGNTCTIVVDNSTASDWLENRLKQMIRRTLKTVTHSDWQLTFEVRRCNHDTP